MKDTKYVFSESAVRMKASKIREVMKYSSMPGIIAFGGGSPDPESFPFEDVKEIIEHWDKSSVVAAMQYGTTTGYAPLVEQIRERMNQRKKIALSGQEIVVTTGGQQGLFLLGKVFVDPGDVVLVEEPSFIGAMASFLSSGAELVGVSLENDGVCIEELENKLLELRGKGKKVKFFYTIPNFQNPKGVFMSMEKRKRLYELSLRYQLPVLEDDPYGDLYYQGVPEDYLPIKSLGNEAPIIYCGSFSKVLCPGFRLGWILGEEEVVNKVGLAKQSVDACSSTFGQVVASDYLAKGKIDAYLEKMRGIYQWKKERMIQEMKKHFPKEAVYMDPAGGFFIYIDLPDGVSGEKLFQETIKEKVAFVSGEPFHTDPVEGDKHVRLSFSSASGEEIEKGIRVIAEKMKQFMR